MEINIFRKFYSDKSTIGIMYLDSHWFCYSLEDKIQANGVKIPGSTAIPEGRYKVIIDYSNRFKCDLPRLLDVPGFEGVRIHAGNTEKDTEGCILVGFVYDQPDIIKCSKLALQSLMRQLKDENEIWINIVGGFIVNKP